MSQDTRREKIKLEILSSVDDMEHFHQDIEVIYVLEGLLTVVVGDTKTQMKEEDILVINANKRHIISGSDNVLYVKCLINYNLVSEMYQSIDIIFWCDSTRSQSERFDELRSDLRKMLDEHLRNHGAVSSFGHVALCYKFLDNLTRYFLVQAADRENDSDEARFEERISQINNYIRANYNQPISLKDLADRLYLSNGYLSRFFKRNYGMPFADYLTNIRLFHAADDLIYSNAPITRIAYDNGFASVNAFNKVFKQVYGETPSSMRKKAKDQKQVEDENRQSGAIEKRLEKYLIDDEKTPADADENCVFVRHSAVASGKLKNFWGEAINIGVASELLRSEVQEHVLILKQALNFRYVRIWNMFAPSLLLNLESPEDNYNFSRVDTIFDFLLSMDLKPHIDFGMKPQMIVYTAQNYDLCDERETDYLQVGLADLEHWKRFVNAFMQHITYRYGSEEVDSWRAELWFSEGEWAEENFDQYLQLFDITHDAIRSYSDGMEIGGCGLRLDFDRGQRERFLQKWQSFHRKPDFISAYMFGYERGEEDNDRFELRSTDRDYFQHQMQRLRGEMELAHFDGMKLYVTETNFTFSVRNYLNDSCFAAADIIKNYISSYGMVDCAIHYLASDRSVEFYDSKELLFGGIGIISRDGIFKPAGFAFDFLGRLYGNYVAHDKGYLITTDNHDDYAIICHNHKPLSYNYFLVSEDSLEREHLWKYYDNRDNLDMDFQLSDVADGTYQMKIYRINEKNGSIMSIWGDLDYEKELSRNDIKYFKRVCEPKLTIQRMKSNEGQLTWRVTLLPNEITFIRIRKVAQ